MKYIVDTNVPVVANKRDFSQASPECISSCVDKIREIERKHMLVLDNNWHILSEYLKRLQSEGQPGVGDAFLKWVLTHQANPQRCELVNVTLTGQDEFAEFPNDVALANFDRADRKFVAVALAHPEHPPIVNAVDTDWRDHRQALETHGLQIEFLCPQEMTRERSAAL